MCVIEEFKVRVFMLPIIGYYLHILCHMTDFSFVSTRDHGG